MSDEILTKVFNQIDLNEDYLYDLLRALVRIPTVNPKFVVNSNLNRETDHQNYLKSVLDQIGFETTLKEVYPERPNLLASWPGKSENSFVLNGHVDVVPEGSHEQWEYPPFEGEVIGDRLYGRGALDMKGGVAAYVSAAKAIRDLGVKLEGRLDIHAVVDEEAGGFGSRDIVEHGYRAQSALISEPTWEVINPAEGGIEWVRVTLVGKAGHAGWRYNSIYPQANPMALEPSVNAIDLGTQLLAAIRDLERDWGLRKKHELLPPGITTINPGAVQAGAGLGEDGLPEILTNPAIVPDVFVADFDLKFLPTEKPKDVRREFEDFIAAFAAQNSWLKEHPPKVQWELGGLRFPGQETSLQHPLVNGIRKAHSLLDMDSTVKGFVAVSDAGHYGGAGIPSVLYGPSGDGLHGLNEYVELTSVKRTAKVVAAAILTCCGVQGMEEPHA